MFAKYPTEMINMQITYLLCKRSYESIRKNRKPGKEYDYSFHKRNSKGMNCEKGKQL